MARTKGMELIPPTGGVVRRTSFQQQSPFTSPDASNVRPYGTFDDRRRIGSRPGTSRAFATRMGSGNPVRLMETITTVDEDDGLQLAKFVGSADGELWKENSAGPPTDIAQVVTTLSNERVAIILEGPPTGGDFTLTYDGNTTAAIQWNARRSDVQTALEALAGLDSTNIVVTNFDWRDATYTVRRGVLYTPSRTRSAGPDATIFINYGWEIEFIGSLGGADASAITGNGAGLTGNNPTLLLVTAPGGTLTTLASDKPLQAVEWGQRLWIADHSDPLDDQTDGVATIYASGARYGFTMRFKLTSASTPDFSALSPAPNRMDHAIRILDGGGANEIYELDLTGGDGGTFTLTVEGSTTVPIDFDADPTTGAASVRALLEDLGSVGVGDVTVTQSAAIYTIEFTGELAGETQTLTANITSVTNVTGEGLDSKQTGGLSLTLGVYEVYAVDGANLYIAGHAALGVGSSSNSKDYTISNIKYRIERSAKVFDPAEDTLTHWTAEPGLGTVPIGNPLIALYNDRLWLAGDPFEPNVWNASRSGNPLDWDTTVDSDDLGRAVSSQNTLQSGKIGQPIRAISPHGDNCMVFGALTQLYLLRGDPASATGRIEVISEIVGVVGGKGITRVPRSSDRLPEAFIYLTRDGVWMLPAGCSTQPVSVSREVLPESLRNVNMSLNQVTMAYDVDGRGVHIAVTPDAGTAGTHFWFDWRDKGFWPVTLTNAEQPTAMTMLDSPEATESATLMGGLDGYVRKFLNANEQDDQSVEIVSFVDIGPISLGGLFSRGSIEKIAADLAGLSGEVIWKIRVGNSAQEAFEETVVSDQGTWTQPGANHASYPRVGGAAAVIQASNGESDQAWALEKIPLRLRQAGTLKL